MPPLPLQLVKPENGESGMAKGMRRERRQAPWWVPMASLIVGIFALFISSCSMLLGPALAAVIAVGGNYATNQTRSAVTEKELATIKDDVKDVKSTVDMLTEQLTKREREDGKVESTLTEHDRRIKEASEKAEQALVRATNAQIEAKTAANR